MGGRGASSGNRKKSYKIKGESLSKSKSGGVSYDAGLDIHSHKDEIAVANWLYNQFGGEIKVLKEINEQHHKTPDYLWDGKYWELKTISSEKAADSAVRNGLKQISANPGGIVLNCVGKELNKENLVNQIDKRVYRNPANDISVIVLSNNKLQLIRTYKKR